MKTHTGWLRQNQKTVQALLSEVYKSKILSFLTIYKQNFNIIKKYQENKNTYFWNDRKVLLYRFPTKIADIGGLEAGEDDGGAHGLGHSLLDIHRGDKELVLASLNFMTNQNKFIPANSAQISLLPLQKVQLYPAIFAQTEKSFFLND